jgi:hypothetical protein
LAVVAIVDGLHNFLMVDSICLAATDKVVVGMVVESLPGASEAVVVAVKTCVSSVMLVADMFAVVFIAGGAVVVSSLGSNSSDMAFGAAVLDAIITVFTAVIFTFNLDVFSHHLFLWLRLSCPGPGIAE